MPMFDFKCGSCGNLFEELVFSSEIHNSEIKGPECGMFESKKQLSAPAVSVGSLYTASRSTSGCGPPVGSGFG